MQSYFGHKFQYSDFEYDLALDIGFIKSKSEAQQLQLKAYLSLENKLNKKHNSLWRELLQPYYQNNIEEKLVAIHADFGLNKETVHTWFDILCRVYDKKRTLVFYGVSNSGKSLLAAALLQPITPGYIQRDGGTNVHWLENIHRKSVILWEEPSIHLTNIEDVKLLLEGNTLVINRKNKNLIERPAGPAVLITTNKRFWLYQPETLLNRVCIFNFNNSITQHYERNELISYVCAVYDGEFDE